MNFCIETIFGCQKILDKRIIRQKKLQKIRPELTRSKILAFQVELAEFAQEWRKFKFWSILKHPDRAACLEEYADGLHFIVSIGNDLGWKKKAAELMGATYQTKSVTEQLILLNYLSGTPKPVRFPYMEIFQTFMGLGELLGFTKNEIFAAYLKKNRVNHRRQRYNY